MKLFLATNSINVDNILSTESIGPLSFYPRREYGYTSFTRLSYTPFDNVLILFSQIPNYEICDNEIDGRPMVLEIEVEDSLSLIKHVGQVEDTDIYSTDEVLRLTPFNTRILFYTTKDLNHARLECSDSLTNKLGGRFHFELCKGEFDLAKVLSKISVEDVCENFDEKVRQDNRINKIKGFIFGYYLGVLKSLSPNSARMLKIQKRIYDIAATVKNNNGQVSESFYNELIQLDGTYRQYDPSIRHCKELWTKYLSELNIPADSMNSLLEKYDKQNVVKFSFMKEKGISPIYSFNKFGIRNVESYSDYIQNHTDQAIADDRKKIMSNLSVKDTFDLDPAYETCMLAGVDKTSTIYNKFIDSILWHGTSPTPESLRTNRFSIATEITKSAKAIWESMNMEWSNSSAQAFMNGLRQNINNFTPFDLGSQDDIILKSIAVYVLKGEDYDSTISFCEDNSLSDYRYVLALWGATTGYVKISKPIMDPLVKTALFGQNYKDILYLLFKIHSCGDLPYKQGEIKVVPQVHELTDETITQESTDRNLQVWQDTIRTYFKELKGVRKKEDLAKDLEKAFVANGEKMNYPDLFAHLNDYQSWKTTKGEPIKAWKDLVEHFCPEEYEKEFGGRIIAESDKEEKKPGLLSKVSEVAQLTLKFITGENEQQKDTAHNSVIYTHGSNFVTDKKCEDFLKSFVPQSSLSEFLRDLKWFQEEYAKGEASQYYHNAPQDNASAIEAYIRYVGRKQYAKSLKLNDMANYLKKIYIRH